MHAKHAEEKKQLSRQIKQLQSLWESLFFFQAHDIAGAINIPRYCNYRRLGGHRARDQVTRMKDGLDGDRSGIELLAREGLNSGSFSKDSELKEGIASAVGHDFRRH